VLTGFRASGKTRVGKLLAQRLAWDFLDSDEMLTRRLGCSISAAVARHGWAWFREREERLLRELCGRVRLVLATGGGAILHDQAWRGLRRSAITIWLRAREETLLARLAGDRQSGAQRPSLTGRSPVEEIRDVLRERTPLYRQGSDFAVDTDGRSPKEVVDEIIMQVNRFGP